MLKIMILCFAVCGLLAGFGAYMIASYVASRGTAPSGHGTMNPWIPAAAAFVFVWGGMSAGFIHWVSKLS